eukprot:gene8573-11585_t
METFFSSFFGSQAHPFMNANNSQNSHFHTSASATTGFNFPGMPGMQQFVNQANNNDKKPPPAGANAIRSLPMVKVTADDLLEASNKECLVCLDEHKLGSLACKLPCGHLFHKPCVTEWLEKHCTCPICRYEIETDDQQYENQRKSRMKKRKLRYRRDELDHKSISQLREIAQSVGMDITGCIDKREIVERLLGSDLITIIEGLPPMEMSSSDFNKKNVSELKHLLLSFGLSTEGALEKSELRSRLLESNRIIIIDDQNDLNSNNYNNNNNSNYYDMERIDYNNKRKNDNNNNNNNNNNISPYDQLKEMSLSELRKLGQQHSISTSGCIDKSEVIERMLKSHEIIEKLNNNNDNNNFNQKINNNSIHSGFSSSFPIKISQNDLNVLSTSELRDILMRSGLEINANHSGTLDSFSMKSLLIDSGKIIIMQNENANHHLEVLVHSSIAFSCSYLCYKLIHSSTMP